MPPTYLEPSHAFSLLWSGEGDPARAIALSRQTIRDLDLETVVAALCPTEQYRKPVKEALYHLPTDPQVIRYRQAVFGYLQANPALAVAFTDLLPALDELASFAHRKWHDQSTLHEVTGSYFL